MLDDEVILTNHPCWGGSHLPDMTVIAASKVRGLKFYLAARGHHADIGGISPGSMPAFSKELTE
jgi:5-oxoprolinase (ATP-hydrolysing)